MVFPHELENRPNTVNQSLPWITEFVAIPVRSCEEQVAKTPNAGLAEPLFVSEVIIEHGLGNARLIDNGARVEVA